MQRVLLINPPESGRGDYSTPPLGLLYLAAVLKKNSIPVDLIDGYIAGWDGIEKKMREYRPTIVGITCHTYSRVKALKVAEAVKKADAKTLVVLGGAHATLMPRQLLEHYPFVDIVARGEGEITFLEMCQGKDLKDIQGIAYREGKEVRLNPERPLIANLDDVPFPAWELIDIGKYPPEGSGRYNGIDLAAEPCVPVVFSRGCIGRCVFCADKLLWKRWRRRSAKNMVDEIEMLNKTYGAKRFNFNDDLFTADRRAAKEVAEEITRRGLRITFEIVSRADCIDPDLLAALKKAGCFKICFGIESASPELLKKMHKEVDVGISEKAIVMTKTMGIRTSALLIVGNLGETRRTINETIDFLNRTGPDEVGLANGLRILPGTELYEHAKKIGFIDDDFWLTDYHWKIFTAENSKTALNIFHDALDKRKPLSTLALVDALKYHRYYWKAFEDLVKDTLKGLGLLKRKKRKGKYEIAY
ncbi:MAG: cobalamin-dependent protein [Candidatus Omnitrophica bacterium]|nr:cobalamin-dependent protein [Candidatus Omnitrophota bacterium]